MSNSDVENVDVSTRFTHNETPYVSTTTSLSEKYPICTRKSKPASSTHNKVKKLNVASHGPDGEKLTAKQRRKLRIEAKRMDRANAKGFDLERVNQEMVDFIESRRDLHAFDPMGEPARKLVFKLAKLYKLGVSVCGSKKKSFVMIKSTKEMCVPDRAHNSRNSPALNGKYVSDIDELLERHLSSHAEVCVLQNKDMEMSRNKKKAKHMKRKQKRNMGTHNVVAQPDVDVDVSVGANILRIRAHGLSTFVSGGVLRPDTEERENNYVDVVVGDENKGYEGDDTGHLIESGFQSTSTIDTDGTYAHISTVSNKDSDARTIYSDRDVGTDVECGASALSDVESVLYTTKSSELYELLPSYINSFTKLERGVDEIHSTSGVQAIKSSATMEIEVIVCKSCQGSQVGACYCTRSTPYVVRGIDEGGNVIGNVDSNKVVSNLVGTFGRQSLLTMAAPKSASVYTSTNVANTSIGKEKEKMQTSPTHCDPSFGAFEQHTRRFGSRMLQQMGFVPGEGLGARQESQGIRDPILPTVRPRKIGLGAKFGRM
eukprot:CFRG7120T1